MATGARRRCPRTPDHATRGTVDRAVLLAIDDKTINVFPAKGTVPTKPPEGDTGRGAFVVRADSTDNGARPLPAHTVDAVVVRRSPQISATRADVISGATTMFEANGAMETVVGVANRSRLPERRSEWNRKHRDRPSRCMPASRDFIGGTIEVRLGSPTGAVVGQADVKSVQLQEGTAEAQLAAVGRGRTTTIAVPIPPTAGARDVYLIFKNDTAKAGQPLISLATVTFER